MNSRFILFFVIVSFSTIGVVSGASVELQVPEVVTDLHAFPVEVTINDAGVQGEANHFQLQFSTRALVNVSGWSLDAGPLVGADLIPSIIGSSGYVAENYGGESRLELVAKVRDYSMSKYDGLRWVEVSFWKVEYLGHQAEYGEDYYSVPLSSQVAVRRDSGWDYYKKSLVAKANSTYNSLHVGFSADGAGYVSDFSRSETVQSGEYNLLVEEVNRYTGSMDWSKSSLTGYLDAYSNQWFRDEPQTVSTVSVPEYFMASEALRAEVEYVFEETSTTKRVSKQIAYLIESETYNNTLVIRLKKDWESVETSEVEALLQRVDQEMSTVLSTFRWTWDESKIREVETMGDGGGSGMNLAIIPVCFTDGAITKDIMYYEGVGERFADYIEEVSFGQVDVNVDVITDDGSWIVVPMSQGQYKNDGMFDWMQEVLSEIDEHVDYTRYDYDSVNGIGIVALVTPKGVRGGSSWITRYNGADGIFQTDDGTSVDCIVTYEQRFTLGGKTNNIRALAHEYTHALGKLLVTVPTGGSKGGHWTVPDEYLMGNVVDKQSLMGKWNTLGVEKVHPDSYIKAWLGWLQYTEVPMGDIVTIKPYSDLRYGDPVYITSFTLPDTQLTGYLIFEYRKGVGDNWDAETYSNNVFSKYLGIYAVENNNNGGQTINYLGPRNTYTTNIIKDPIAGIKGEILSFTDEGVQFKVTPLEPKKKLVVKLDSGSENLEALNQVGSHEVLENISRPDLDLHGYTSDGSHIGIDYNTGEYEMGVEGVETSGDLLGGVEWIMVPDGVEMSFSVTARDNADFLNMFQDAQGLTDGAETYSLVVDYFDESGVQYSEVVSETLGAGDASDVTVDLSENGDGSYSISAQVAPTVKEELVKDVEQGGLLDNVDVDLPDSVDDVKNMIPGAPLVSLVVGVLVFVLRKRDIGTS